MGKTSIPLIAAVVSMSLHPLWCYFFIMPSQLDMGIVGCGIAKVITFIILFLVNVIYSSYLPELEKAVFLPDRRIFHDLIPYLKLGIPGVFVVSLDVTSSILVNILAGWISVDCQAA